MYLFLNLLFETDSYSNEYLLARFGFDTAENELSQPASRERALQSLPKQAVAVRRGRRGVARVEELLGGGRHDQRGPVFRSGFVGGLHLTGEASHRRASRLAAPA